MSGHAVHCRRETYDVYIGRARTRARGGRASGAINSYSHRPSRVPGVIVVGSRQEAIPCYRTWAWKQIRSGRISLETLAALHGKRLGCPDPCHGEVLAAAAAWAWQKLRAPHLFAAGEGIKIAA
jgi:uncharacterized protein DUF4326